ncbi:hypothetical protein BDZ45DRAFT_735828 [Acephala macrosclerotiorum]|nr:hypothetical protein BDZ45DRAFT_735828 [Acephala macrosclerotiorum]
MREGMKGASRKGSPEQKKPASREHNTDCHQRSCESPSRENNKQIRVIWEQLERKHITEHILTSSKQGPQQQIERPFLADQEKTSISSRQDCSSQLPDLLTPPLRLSSRGQRSSLHPLHHHRDALGHPQCQVHLFPVTMTALPRQNNPRMIPPTKPPTDTTKMLLRQTIYRSYFASMLIMPRCEDRQWFAEQTVGSEKQWTIL